MAKSSQKSSGSSPSGSKLSPRTVLILIAAAVVYLLVRPSLSAWLGIDLPGLLPEGQVAVNHEQPVVPDNSANAGPSTSADSGAQADRPDHTDDSPSVVNVTPSTDATAATSPESTTVGPRDPPPAKPKPTPKTSARPPPTTPGQTPSTEPRLGQLTDLGGKRYRSTAGLVYVQLRSEHRVEHVMRHGKDDPSRPVHGVFNGDQDAVLAVIDEAWQLARRGKPPTVQVEDQGDRTVFVVDLGRKIGFMGGQAGKRKSFPPCRHLQLVVEGDEVVTAYPVIPR